MSDSKEENHPRPSTVQTNGQTKTQGQTRNGDVEHSGTNKPSFLTAWGSTSGKPCLFSPRLDDPKSSSVVTTYFSSNAIGKSKGSEADDDTAKVGKE